MTDKEFLVWIHERLEKIHGENGLYDYMHRLRSVIANTDIDEKSPPIVSNKIEDVK